MLIYHSNGLQGPDKEVVAQLGRPMSVKNGSWWIVMLALTVLALAITFWILGYRNSIQDMRVHWEYIPQVQNAAFNGTDTAWLVTIKGDFLRTENGGQSWEVISGKTVGDFDYIAFIDNQHGWATTKQRHVLRTDDSGRTWFSIAKLGERKESGPLGQIKFVDDKHGWIVNPFFLYRTDDGGMNWEQYPTPYVKGKLVYYSFFLNSRIGWLSGPGGVIFRTKDGGKTWQTHTEVSTEKALGEMSFIDQRTGWIVSPMGGIYRTDDGGITWEPLRLPGEIVGLDSVDFINKSEGWVVGVGKVYIANATKLTERIVLHTMDSGNSWQRIQSPKDQPLLSQVHFADSRHGWILARDNVYRTTDSGKTWNTVLELPPVGKTN